MGVLCLIHVISEALAQRAEGSHQRGHIRHGSSLEARGFPLDLLQTAASLLAAAGGTIALRRHSETPLHVPHFGDRPAETIEHRLPGHSEVAGDLPQREIVVVVHLEESPLALREQAGVRVEQLDDLRPAVKCRPPRPCGAEEARGPAPGVRRSL
jgi:hypothetical protein